ncbi:hypothetical protein VTK56DRAFT_3864 [Thermocarpiscus australiensis]
MVKAWTAQRDGSCFLRSSKHVSAAAPVVSSLCCGTRPTPGFTSPRAPFTISMDHPVFRTPPVYHPRQSIRHPLQD